MNYALKKRIMRKVYTVYALRKILSKTAFKIYVAVALLFGIKVFIHVSAVIRNLPNFRNLSGLYNFLLYAVVNTEVAVQFIIFGITALVVWIMKDMVKNIFIYKIREQIYIQ